MNTVLFSASAKTSHRKTKRYRYKHLRSHIHKRNLSYFGYSQILCMKYSCMF